GQDGAGDAFADSFPFLTGTSIFNTQFPSSSLTASSSEGLPLSVFDPNLKLPYALRWNFSAQRVLGSSQSISIAYVGSVGRRLLSTQTLFDKNPEFSFIRLTTNQARSDYRALQVEFNRQVAKRLAAVVSYTWSKSSDNAGQDSAANALVASSSLEQDRGPSDFDIRHSLSGFVSYEIPVLVANGAGN